MAEATQQITTAGIVGPYAMSTGSIGGGPFGLQEAVSEYHTVREGGAWMRLLLPAAGLNNIGLLVRVAGRVTATGAGYFYIDDGAACDDGSGATGVRVLSGSFSMPPIGSRVAVTAISSTYFHGGNLFRALLLPSQENVQILD